MVSVPDGQNTGERYGLAGKEPAAIVLGLMAGVRFNADSDTPNSVDEKGNTLYYPDARPKARLTGHVLAADRSRPRGKVSRALAAWAAAGVRGAISLGNIIDRGNGMMRTRKAVAEMLSTHDAHAEGRGGDAVYVRGVQEPHVAMEAVAEMLSTFAEFKSHTWRWRLSHVHSENVFRSAVLHVPGEHDLAYASVEEVTDLMGFSTYTSSRQSPPGHAYHMVASPDLEKREEARAFLDKKRRQGGDATVSGGAVGRTQLTWLREQLTWLRDQLASAGAAGDKAVVFSYAPLSESLARQGDASLVCWNCKEVMEVMFAFSGVVPLCLTQVMEVMFAFPGVVPLCLSGQQLLGGRAEH
ncbi:hypothetical protein T484DRAFT_1766271 [Baffinella frigidus]|nr:hypothetical protein T484DRAFT_1766271 [Cryptophyta sp. CCMP2293]